MPPTHIRNINIIFVLILGPGTMPIRFVSKFHAICPYRCSENSYGDPFEVPDNSQFPISYSHFLPSGPFSYFPKLNLYNLFFETYLDLCATPYYIEIYSGEFLLMNENQVIVFFVGNPFQMPKTRYAHILNVFWKQYISYLIRYRGT